MGQNSLPHRIAASLLLAVLASPATPQEAAPPSALALTAVEVEPSTPGPDTLCRLAVTIRNSGDEVASQLGFAVKLNGQDLTVYGNQLFMYAVPAGGELRIPLYNFWTTETSRPAMPADGKYRVDVSLNEAQWMDISTVTETVDRAGAQVEEDVEVWTPLGAVEGLPVAAGVTLEAGGG
ncbi:MAG: hypothetical protein OES32_00385 [Acidobacteriota bacterium]|nr:hypothetical protein [Acidobacteriota bacterium]MDH3522015.1 hypothetical protein [Acidobacteriota bacterium]